MEVLEAYYRAGFRRFDCADIYTGVEALLGSFRRAHGLGAGELAVHTKYVPDRSALATLTPGQTERAIDRSRSRLGVDTLDLVQFHWWDYAVPGYLAALETLATLQQRGAIRAIGLTNFDAERSAEILAHGLPIASIQTQYSLLDRRPAKHLAALAGDHGVPLLCYGSIAGGLLSDRYLDAPPPREPHENRSLTKYLLILEELGGWGTLQALLPALRTVADEHGTDIATVAAACCLARPGVRACIVGVRHPRHLDRHLALRDGFALSAGELATIEAVRARFGEVAGAVYQLERDMDSAHGRIMRYELNSGGA
jgi:aryl-alcohol dehydrogenase-like predicted oxidoreductase